VAIVAGLAIVAALVAVPTVTRRSSRRVIDRAARSAAPEFSVVGGMSFTRAQGGGRGSSSPAPFAMLSIFDWGVRLGPRARPFGAVTRTVELRYEEIRSVDVVRSYPMRDYGVRFRAPALDMVAVFWGGGPGPVLDRLSAHGAPVTRTETQFGFVHWIGE